MSSRSEQAFIDDMKRTYEGVLMIANGIGAKGFEVEVPELQLSSTYGRRMAYASEAPIQPGDLLTTSSRPGYAMKAADPAQAWGAILGKAMTAL